MKRTFRIQEYTRSVRKDRCMSCLALIILDLDVTFSGQRREQLPSSERRSGTAHTDNHTTTTPGSRSLFSPQQRGNRRFVTESPLKKVLPCDFEFSDADNLRVESLAVLGGGFHKPR